jgi:nitrous oxidase accessory protein NosD
VAAQVKVPVAAPAVQVVRVVRAAHPAVPEEQNDNGRVSNEKD